MKKIIGVMVAVAMLVIPVVGMAGRVEIDSMKANKGYNLIEYKIPMAEGQNLKYVIDPLACVCLVEGQRSGSISTFDCKQLYRHPELAKHVEQCK